MIKKTLFKKKWKSCTSWSSSKSGGRISGYIEFVVYYDFRQGLRFSTSVPNYTFCSRSPFKCIFDVLEHESKGNAKHIALEQRVENLGYSRNL